MRRQVATTRARTGWRARPVGEPVGAKGKALAARAEETTGCMRCGGVVFSSAAGAGDSDGDQPRSLGPAGGATMIWRPESQSPGPARLGGWEEWRPESRTCTSRLLTRMRFSVQPHGPGIKSNAAAANQRNCPFPARWGEKGGFLGVKERELISQSISVGRTPGTVFVRCTK